MMYEHDSQPCHVARVIVYEALLIAGTYFLILVLNLSSCSKEDGALLRSQ